MAITLSRGEGLYSKQYKGYINQARAVIAGVPLEYATLYFSNTNRSTPAATERAGELRRKKLAEPYTEGTITQNNLLILRKLAMDTTILDHRSDFYKPDPDDLFMRAFIINFPFKINNPSTADPEDQGLLLSKQVIETQKTFRIYDEFRNGFNSATGSYITQTKAEIKEMTGLDAIVVHIKPNLR